MSDTNNQNTASPAQPTPSVSAGPRKFGAIKRSAPVAEPDPAPAGGDAQPEGSNGADALTEIDFDAALAHTSDGLHRGKIAALKTFNGKGTNVTTGVSVVVIHEDGTRASSLFSLRNIVKDASGKPRLDDKGAPIVENNIRGQKAWAEFAGAFGQNAKELMQAVVAYGKKETGELPPIVGVEAMWNFKTGSGGFLNCDYNAEETATMIAADASSAA